MDEPVPSLVALDHDDYAAKFVGRTADGRQFFLTTPFLPGQRDFLALYLFDAQGNLLNAAIEDLGPRQQVDEQAAAARQRALLASLGEVSFERITVRPFSVERFGTTFGFVPEAPEDDDDDWRVVVEPGNYMCFFEPWDSGEYDT
jgi:hypothetical protein